MPEPTSSSPISDRRIAITAVQGASAVVLSAVVFLVLIAVPRVSGRRIAFTDALFGNWSLFVCLLLAFWALAVLFTRWNGVRKRDIGKSTVDPESLRVTGDNILADRAARAVAHFRLSQDPASAADLLRGENEAAQAQLESAYVPVRVFLWAIPVLGLIGTVMGVGQAARTFAALVSSGGNDVEHLRNALVQATANLGSAFETTMAALLLTVLVMAVMMMVQQKERTVLQSVDDFCRLQLLPLMITRREQETPAVDLEQLRAENAAAYRRNVELAQQYAEQTSALNATITEKLDQLQTTAPAADAAAPGPAAAPIAEKSAPLPAPVLVDRTPTPAPAALNPQYAGELQASLEELRDGIRALRPFLTQVAENLRRQADEAAQPLAIRVKVTAQRKASAAAAD